MVGELEVGTTEKLYYKETATNHYALYNAVDFHSTNRYNYRAKYGHYYQGGGVGDNLDFVFIIIYPWDS